MRLALRMLMVVTMAFFLHACAGTAPLAPKAMALNRDGVAAMEAGDLLTAEARFALALEYHPKFVDARVNLGLLEMQRGNFELARTQLEKAVTINRHLAQPHHGLGVLAERQGKLQEALEHYEDALEVDPGFAPSRANIARLYFEAGKLDEAREQYLRLIQVAPREVTGWVGLAETQWRLGRDQQAERTLSEAARYVAEAPLFHLYRARVAIRHGRLRLARELLAPLVKQRDSRLARDAWSWLGVLELLENRSEDAVACAEKALHIDPDAALPTYVLAMALERQGDPDARSWLDRAAKLAPNDSTIMAARRRLEH